MRGLPSFLRSAWPIFKRLHRVATRVVGALSRWPSGLAGERALPRRATALSRDTARLAPASVRVHPGGGPERIDRVTPVGVPADHWTFRDAASFDVPARFTVEIERGIVVGDYAANVTAERTLDYETSEYFGISGWREHPIFLRPMLPPIERFDGSMVSLSTRGGAGNYYHFLIDVLPRWGVLQESLPSFVPDHLYVPCTTNYERELLAMLGLDKYSLVAAARGRAVSADRLFVPSLPNPLEVAPPWTVQWLREHLPSGGTANTPSRLYVTRGSGRNTRRLVDEDRLWPLLERRGFVRIDPGAMTVREQIDHFSAADVVVGLHGAALTNLVFLKPGARVLHLFAPGYVKHCFWAICASIPGVRYEYLVGQGPTRRSMNAVQQDIRIDASSLDAAVERLLAS